KNDDFTFANNETTVEHYTGESLSFAQLVVRRFLRNKGAVIALSVIILIAVFVFTVPLFSRFAPEAVDPSHSNLAPGSLGHWFGTDNLGRDIFTR
ncbi:ABC transporter permease, partial [Lacticaseibacillus paracasei]|nr:ABC transporter permease [Lacticaseibacillus paracasei]